MGIWYWACRKCERPRLFPLLEDSPNAKHWAVHGWYFAISISSIHTLIWNSSSNKLRSSILRFSWWSAVSVGWWRSIFGCALVRNCGEDEESHETDPGSVERRFKNQLVFQIKQAVLVQNRSKKWARISVKPGNIAANGARIIHLLSKIRVPLLHILRQSYVHNLLLYFKLVCAKSLEKCGRFGPSVNVAVMEVSLLPAQPMHQRQSALIDLNRHCHKPKGGFQTELILGSKKKTNKKTMITWQKATA